MKIWLIPFLWLLASSAQAETKESDIQTFAATVLEKEGVTLIRNDLSLPIRVTKDQVGSVFACLKDGKKITEIRILLVVNNYFKKQDAILLVCEKSGRFAISDDFI
jgi:hypothetical protein